MPLDSEVVHFDGGSFNITGMNIENTYDKVLIRADDQWEGDEMAYAGSTGLFSFVYKARVANIRLMNPVITLTETSGIATAEDNDDYEIGVIDAMGSIIGVSQNSRVNDIHVGGLNLNYTASFGEFITPCEPNYALGSCAFYSPLQILSGGAIGYSYAQTIVRNTSVNGGVINVAPNVDETGIGWNMDALYYGGVSMGGIVGYNYQSAIMNTCNNAKVKFSDDGYKLNDRSPQDQLAPYDAPLYGYSMFYGGIVGMATSEVAIRTCVYNSCAHSDLEIDATISAATYIGGIAGGVAEDSLINNFFDGNITADDENYVGEIVGAMEVSNGNGYMVASNYYLDRGTSPYGESYNPLTGEEFETITTIKQLVDNLNAGRSLVMANILDHTNFDNAFLDQYVLEWAVQDGTGALDCSNTTTAGLKFPDNSMTVPDTGGHL